MLKKKIKEFEDFIEQIIPAEIKRQAIENNILNRGKIFDEVKQFSKNNLFTLGTEPKSIIGDQNSFGIFGNHRYDFLDCEKHNESFFFSLWNPHGNNKILNEYEGFDEINKRNKEGRFNGNIILSFDGFFLSFKRIIYQNRDELLKMYKKYHSIGYLDFFLNYHMRMVLMTILGPDIIFIISLLLIKKNKEKGKNNKEIFAELLNGIRKDNKEKEEKMDKFQNLWFLSIWNDLKKDIIKESEDIMTKKSKTNLNTIDKEEIIKILIKENENKNEFLVMFSQTKEKFLKEKLQEINKEIELIAIKIAEEYIKQNKKEVKKSYDDKEEHNYFNISFDEEIVIRSSLTYKNLDIEYNNIKSGTKIILYDAHGGGSQSFLKVDNNDGTFSFKKYGYALDVRFSEIKNGTQIQIWEYNGTKAQKFYLKDRGNGYVSIHSAINKNYCIDVSNSGTHNFNKIQLWESNGTNAQKFKLIPINIQKNEREENERNRIKEEEHRRMQEENHRKHIEDLARRTIKGEFGSGEERKNRLGGEFKEVQNKVNEILGCSFRYKI